ncbi:hypothetical protein VTN00DRAFT_9696 [Thermoascus crustaceus]|uniref:uncharacterized protein n=1 Tax=Thermoascus crustaceus TaxID=5088 RepID=UPI0037437E33
MDGRRPRFGEGEREGDEGQQRASGRRGASCASQRAGKKQAPAPAHGRGHGSWPWSLELNSGLGPLRLARALARGRPWSGRRERPGVVWVAPAAGCHRRPLELEHGSPCARPWDERATGKQRANFQARSSRLRATQQLLCWVVLRLPTPWFRLQEKQEAFPVVHALIPGLSAAPEPEASGHQDLPATTTRTRGQNEHMAGKRSDWQWRVLTCLEGNSPDRRRSVQREPRDAEPHRRQWLPPDYAGRGGEQELPFLDKPVMDGVDGASTRRSTAPSKIGSAHAMAVGTRPNEPSFSTPLLCVLHDISNQHIEIEGIAHRLALLFIAAVGNHSLTQTTFLS